MIGHAALVVALIAAQPAPAAEHARVTAAQILGVARTALEAKAGASVPARFAPVGRVDDLALAAVGEVELRAAVPGTWLRERIGVPVEVFVAGHRVSAVTTWFSVSVPARGLVYDGASPRGTGIDALHLHAGDIDLARTHGVASPDVSALAGHRLRRAVHAGDAVVPADFEQIPDVLAQQSVRVDAVSGTIHLSIAGRALADGRIGEFIQVLPSGASQPVRARVVSDKVVSLEN